jgi:hypothetical protein
LCVLLPVIQLASCGDDDGGGNPIDGGAGAIDAPLASSEPCDFESPIEVEVGVPVSRALPSADCTGRAHFYRFSPLTSGVYSIQKSGLGSLGFCESEGEGGCICGININCCTECTLTFDLPNGDPLPAGSNNQIYIDNVGGDSGTYSFTVTGPQ